MSTAIARLNVAILALAVLLSPAAWAGCLSQGGPGYILVKTQFSSYISVADNAIDCNNLPGHNIVQFQWTFVTFQADPPPTIWNGSGDPGKHDTNVLTYSNPVIVSGDYVAPYTISTKSLKDLGTYEYQFDGVDEYIDDQGQQQVVPMQPDVMPFIIGNTPPSANIQISGTEKVGNTITVNGNGSDVDPGALHYNWSIPQRPPNSPSNFSSATVASPTIALNDKHDIGDWQVKLDLADAQGELKTFTKTFTVPNQPPTVTVNGSLTIDALDHLHLEADPALDADGETITWGWELVSAPPNSTHQPVSNFSTAQVIDFVTGPKDIGAFTFKCTATDEHNATAVANAVVTVKAIPPTITLQGSNQIKVGQPIHFETTKLNDAYGDPLKSFQWDLRQVPIPANTPLNPSFSTEPSVDVSTTISSAGYWIFKLTVTDQVDQTADATAQVLVDAPPTATIIGTDQAGNLASAIDLDGSTSSDPDAPANALPPDYGYLHADPNVVHAPGIVSYTWSLSGVPPELWGANYHEGLVQDVLQVDGSSAKLHLAAGTLLEGTWQFDLDVTDGEGNHATDSHQIAVIDENLPPTPWISPPAVYSVDVDGLVASDITVSGVYSFDLDNLLNQAWAPGLGITHYKWEIIQSPPGCNAPALPDSGNATTATLYTAGSTVPIPCQGTHQIRLTVTDDDTPTPKAASAVTTVMIGNCAGQICIDYPTQASQQFVKFTDQTDVLIYYHLNSALYNDQVLVNGLRLQLDIFHESDLVNPAYNKSWDVDVLPSNLGGPLAEHWYGKDNLGNPPKPGLYTITLQIVDSMGANTGYSATESNAVRIQKLDVSVADTSSKYVSADGLVKGSDPVKIDYQVKGQLNGDIGFDEMRFRVYDKSNTKLYDGTTMPPFNGSFAWNGDTGGSSFLPPESYSLELEILDEGKSLGISPRFNFTIYRLTLQPASGPVKDTPPGLYVMVNDDDDDLNGVSDMTESAPGENDLVEVDLKIEPAIEGKVTISSPNSPAPFKLWDAVAKANETVLPATLNLPADTLPAKLFVEGQRAASSKLTMQLLTKDNVTLGPLAIAITTVDVQLMVDTNDDFLPDNQAYVAHVGLWDFAFRIAADANGAAGTLYNQEDQSTLAGASMNPENFIGRDSRRFYFQVSDPAANTNNGAAEEIPAANFEWFTVKANGMDDDHPPTNATITLTETGANTGIFSSQAQLVVSDKIDRDQPTNTGVTAHAGTANYDQANHRTRQVTGPDGTVVARYRPAGITGPVFEIRNPVFQRKPMDEWKVLTVHIFNFADPMNNMIPAIPQATIDAFSAVVQERYTALGIRVVINYNPLTDLINLPGGSPVNLNNVGTFTIPGAYNTLTPSADQTALINLVRAVDPAGPGNANTLYMMFIGNFSSGDRGQSFPDGWLPGGSIAKNFMFVAGRAASNDYSGPHEIGHMLTNETLTANEANGVTAGWATGGHYGGAQPDNNLMRNGTIATMPRRIDNTKRLWHDTLIHTIDQFLRIQPSRFLANP